MWTPARLLAVALCGFFSAGCGTARFVPGSLSQTVDLGDFILTEPRTIKTEFEFRNPLDRPVKIVGERHSCTCSSVELPLGAVPPGEAVTVSVAMSLAAVRIERSTTRSDSDLISPAK